MITQWRGMIYKRYDSQCLGEVQSPENLEVMIWGEWYPIDYKRLEKLQSELYNAIKLDLASKDLSNAIWRHDD